MKLLDLITYGYSYFLLIPFLVVMLEMKYTLGKILYFLITAMFGALYFMNIDLEKIKLVPTLVTGLQAVGGFALLYAAIKFKQSHTERRLEANVFLMIMSSFFYIVSNPSVLCLLFIIVLIAYNSHQFFGGMTSSKWIQLKTKFYTTTYTIELAKQQALNADQEQKLSSEEIPAEEPSAEITENAVEC